MTKRRKRFEPEARAFAGRAPGRVGDFVMVVLNTQPKAIALAGWVIRSNKKGYLGLVAHSWTTPLVLDVEPVEDCLTFEMAIPDVSVLMIGAAPVKPVDCRCADLADERGWGDDRD